MNHCLLEVFETTCLSNLNTTIFYEVGYDGKVNKSRTYGEVYSRALFIAKEIMDNSNAGDRVIICTDSVTEFIEYFFGCVFSSVISVPISLNSLSNNHKNRASTILRNCEPSLIVGDKKIIDSHGSIFQGLKTITNEDLGNYIQIKNKLVRRRDEIETIFIQYSSGSTGNPKGVKISSENLLANSYMMYKSFGVLNTDKLCSWLPFIHDMGLVGCIITPLIYNIQTYFIPTMTFIKRPLLWLEVIQNFEISLSGGPNFAYELVTQKLKSSNENVKSFDLSKWRVAFCGSDTIYLETLRNFYFSCKKFQFKESAIRPCYGLAEATLLVTATQGNIKINLDNIQCKNNHNKSIVSCGIASEGCDILILDEYLKICKFDNEIGEICVSGRHLTSGYWEDEVASEQLFIFIDDKKYIRTGDFGYLKNGELYFTGRKKDLIKLYGKNIHPEDIEEIVQRAAGNYIYKTAAFSIEDGDLKIIVVAEVQKTVTDQMKEALSSDVNSLINSELGISIGDLVYWKFGKIPRTTSGKVMRGRTKELYLEEIMLKD